jgi:hypothetical protein
MHALVNLETLALADMPHEPAPPAAPEGFAWWPIETQRPPFNRKTDICMAGELYADPPTRTVRRLWVVREKSPYELAEERGLHVLKMLSVSDQPTVRALEDILLVIMDRLKITFDDLPPEAAKKLGDRAAWRGQIK